MAIPRKRAFWKLTPHLVKRYGDDPVKFGRVCLLLSQSAIFKGRQAGKVILDQDELHAAYEKLDKLLHASRRDIQLLLAEMVTNGDLEITRPSRTKVHGAVYKIHPFGNESGKVVTNETPENAESTEENPPTLVTNPQTAPAPEAGPENVRSDGNGRKKEEEGTLRVPAQPDSLSQQVSALLEQWPDPDEVTAEVVASLARSVDGSPDRLRSLASSVKVARLTHQFSPRPLAEVLRAWRSKR